MFRLCVGICPDDISWTAQPSGTKVGMVVYCLKMECNAEEFIYYLKVKVTCLGKKGPQANYFMEACWFIWCTNASLILIGHFHLFLCSCASPDCTVEGFALCVSGKLLLMLQSIKRGIAACPNDPKLHTCLVHFYMFGKSPPHTHTKCYLSFLCVLVPQCIWKWTQCTSGWPENAAVCDGSS